MKNFFQLSIFIFIISSAHGQSVLDNVYVQQPSVHIVYNDNLFSRYRNPFLAITRPYYDTIYNKSDSILSVYIKKYPQKPLEIKDCVYFNPMEKYISNSSAKQLESIFALNMAKKSKTIPAQIIFPNSLRFYVNTNNLTIKPGYELAFLDSNFAISYDLYLRPFYFRKYEVTNAEYREFTNWVIDSISRTLLAQCGFEDYTILTIEKDGSQKSVINWKTPIKENTEEVSICFEALYKPVQERFYAKREIDSRKLNYTTIKIKGDTIITNSINVYPDTNGWVNDFLYSYNEPMRNMYFWHPAYDDYPVVDITYWQALAYMDWRTRQEQKKLDSKGIKLKVEYDLPTEAEWEIAATAEKREKGVSVFTPNYLYLADNDWITDLSLDSKNRISHDSLDTKINTKYIWSRRNLLFDQTKNNFIFPASFIVDGTFHTFKSDLNKINKQEIKGKYNSEKDNDDAWALLMCNKDANDISYMGGNVSEWLKESYQQNWLPVFTKHQQALSTVKGDDAKILLEMECYFDKNNDKDGRLVRGTNWFDERFSSRLGKNTEGTNAKTFVSPDKSYCTLGFRYVVHYEPKK